MGKLIALINTTPDGFVGSEFVIADAEFHEYVHGLLANTQTVAFGRNTFELFQGVWPPILEGGSPHASQVKMARKLNDIDKTVFSSTLAATKWNNSIIVKSMDAEAINNFKQTSSMNMLTIGSPGLVAALTKLGLVDEYHFSIQPVIAGNEGGVRLFDKISMAARQPLQFVGATQLKSGVVIISYQKAG
ncbi:dihydrofolate reductase family protein [Chitinophaga agrisoli]|uniref:Dihydrofolate reductase family protein n=1 Tax=Chitinophaga agrisoli TaxID=2607653 RepID=A0A5B2VR94_9BACT|nr:dihydrofolate reductase family protein [Chitinophaga agrisoli]KAA2240697.1 dihydrofolate reductase family protein [Chitinophaga agrisoli]